MFYNMQTNKVHIIQRKPFNWLRVMFLSDDWDTAIQQTPHPFLVDMTREN